MVPLDSDDGWSLSFVATALSNGRKDMTAGVSPFTAVNPLEFLSCAGGGEVSAEAIVCRVACKNVQRSDIHQLL